MYNEASVESLVSVPIVNEQQSSPVLLETGPHDEAVRYLASFRPVSYAGEYLVYVAESSLLLDLVRFKRSVNVIASFSGEQRFAGILSIAKVPALNNHSALALTLTEGLKNETFDNEGFCPIT